MKHKKIIRVGGWLMLMYAAIIIGIPMLLDILTKSEHLIYSLEQYKLFAVAKGSVTIHLMLLIYALSPLLLIPGAISAYYIFLEKFAGFMHIASYFALIGIMALTFSLLMLPSVDWIVASYIQNFTVSHQNIFIVLLMALNSYLGVYIGDILGIGCLTVWFAMVSIAMIRSQIFPLFVGIFELSIASLIVIDIALRYLEISPTIYANIQVQGLIGLWLFVCGICAIKLELDYE